MKQAQKNPKDITTELDKVWNDIWKIIGDKELCVSERDKCEDIQRRLSYFSDNHSANPDHIDDVIESLSKGFNLTKSAVQWHNPVVGNKTDDGTSTDEARGIQWRLVMAYSGFEIVTKTLLNKTNERKAKPKIKSKQKQNNQTEIWKLGIIDFQKKCGLEDESFDKLVLPEKKLKHIDRWLKKEVRSQKKEALLHFLGVDNGDAKIIQYWIIEPEHEPKPISTWADAAQLAKALRNASAHGALSATKVDEWGLRKPMLTLGNNLGEFVVAGLGKLTSP